MGWLGMTCVPIPPEWQGWVWNDWTGPRMTGWEGPRKRPSSFPSRHSWSFRHQPWMLEQGGWASNDWEWHDSGGQSSQLSLKRAIQIQLKNVEFRSVGHSIQKLWPKMDFPLCILWASKKCWQTVIFQDKNLKIEIWAIPIGWHPVLTRFLSTREKCFFGSPYCPTFSQLFKVNGAGHRTSS